MHYTKEQLALSPSAHELDTHNRTAQLQRQAEGRIVRSRDGPKNCSLIDSTVARLSKGNTTADDSERSKEPGAGEPETGERAQAERPNEMNTDERQKSECEGNSKAPDGIATQVRTSAGGEDTTALVQGPNASE
jgi:hypothetical protein